MFHFKKKKGETGMILSSPVRGKAVSLSQVNDPTFSEGMLGKGMAVMPEEGNIYAPADGEISLVFDTLHAVNMVTSEGIEVLIHIGLDTVTRKGAGFQAHVATGDHVKKGDLLLTVDLDALRADGFDTIIPVVVCNTDDYAEVLEAASGEVAAGEDLIRVKK
ncbi:MAG: PTS glucose transporter subunit IIA [Lachnospiraceae bacterium]